MGFASALFLGFKESQKFSRCVWASFSAQFTLAMFLLLMKWEGAICLFMGMPLTLTVGLIGSWLGWRLSNAIVDYRKRRVGMSAAFLIPVAIVALTPSESHTSHHRHVTVRVISAAPEKIWPWLFTLDRLPTPTEWVFRAGMAYPVGTTTKGLRRVCLLSTGPMPEKIRVREENRRLAFDVLDVPPSIRETNPFGEVHASHDLEAFRPTAGEFRLEPLPGGRTRVIATTWYDHDYAPEAYWSLWTEAVVCSVHNRVLDEVERRAVR